MLKLVFCLQTIKQNEPAPHSDAVLGLRLLLLTLHGRSTALNCAITIVQYRPYQYRRILYGHVVGMVRCDWPPAPSIIIKHFFNYYYGMFLKHCLGRQHSALDSSYCRITCQTDSIGSQRLNVTCHSYATMLIKIIILTKTLKLLFKSGSIYYI